MNIIAICAVCIITALLCRVLAKDGAGFSALLSLCAVIMIGAVFLYNASDALSLAKRLYDSSVTDSKYFDIMIKGAGICIITKTASDSCRDCGENALASAAETAGRLAMLMTAMPLFSGVLSLVEELID
ncbi:stage III sporulation AC/AD family protein [Ruminococcus sp. NK3A76]|uniref:stage III sporulation AC/AD family protein n=1 Tax=Ruminococcus sp. NK3A76 TaxID=877411 RepID=UPI00048CA6BC|nr:stage III sporulation AC/AD family protein [Ruminococcus sp. NK3A76]